MCEPVTFLFGFSYIISNIAKIFYNIKLKKFFTHKFDKRIINDN